ncbi:MAG: thioredoxin domain-containing protein [Patescibacteria group bacterium]
MYSLAKPALSGSVPAVSEIDHVRGGASAPVTLIEYSDFQCPACSAFEPLLQSVLATYGDNLQVVYRHFPLYTIHANAEEAAYASEAAAQQGKFWEMHDLLFDRQADWESLADTTDMFVAYAELLELDVEQFTSDITSDAVRDRVKIDVNSANAAGISATPTFYLNGTALSLPKGESPETYLKAQIDAVLATLAPATEQTTPDVTTETTVTP